jgi:hypothetical protein
MKKFDNKPQEYQRDISILAKVLRGKTISLSRVDETFFKDLR